MINDLDSATRYITERRLPTPVMFYDENKMIEAYGILRDNTPSGTSLYYALKSCYNVPLLKAISSLGMGAEVMSEMEFDLALKNKFKKLIVNGMGRSKAFLTKVATTQGTCIILDSLNDVKNIEEICTEHEGNIHVGVRVNLNLPRHGKSYYQTTEHKLGNDQKSAFFTNFIRICNQYKNIKWDILHAHVTINERKSAIYEETIAELGNIILDLSSKGSITPNNIDLGGGFEVYNPDSKDDFIALFKNISSSFIKVFPDKTLVLEPGRFLSAYSGFSVGKVLDIKQVGAKYWIITDIGTNTLIPITSARYQLIHPRTVDSGMLVGLTDGITSPTNNIIDNLYIEQLPLIGDYICVGNTGAYTDVYSTFWAFSPHLVCFIDKVANITEYRTSEDIQKMSTLLFKKV